MDLSYFIREYTWRCRRKETLKDYGILVTILLRRCRRKEESTLGRLLGDPLVPSSSQYIGEERPGHWGVCRTETRTSSKIDRCLCLIRW